MLALSYWHEFREFFSDGSLWGILLLNVVGGLAGGFLVACWLQRRWKPTARVELSSVTGELALWIANLLLAHGLDRDMVLLRWFDPQGLLALFPDTLPEDARQLSKIVVEGGSVFDRFDAAIQRLPGDARGPDLQPAFHAARLSFKQWGSLIQTASQGGTQPITDGFNKSETYLRSRSSFLDNLRALFRLLPEPFAKIG